MEELKQFQQTIEIRKKPTKELLETLYLENKKSIREIAKILNYCANTIDYYLIKYGILKRNKIESCKLRVINDIQEFIKIRKHQSNPYLFDKGTNYHISGRTVWKVLQRQARECNIAQNVHPHLLRDSFATHLLESGVDSRYIQRLLGHVRLETTTKYTRVADVNLMSIKSPLDLPV